MADGLDGMSSTMSELHYGGSRASSPGISMLRDYRQVLYLIFSDLSFFH